nr:hypothetical protein [Candidatus Saccharibacteria bacterium]
SARSQISLLDSTNRAEWLTQAVDEVNDKYGNFVICTANSIAGKSLVKQKIPFGSTRYFELLLKEA